MAFGAKTLTALMKEVNEDASLAEFNAGSNASFKMNSGKALEALVEPLKKHKSIKKLILTDCEIADDGCKFIAEILRGNHVIEELNLEKNKISSAGASMIADALASNNGLRTLHLKEQAIKNFGEDALDHFIFMFKDNVTLTKISWRLDSHKSVMLHKLETRNVEIKRCQDKGADFDSFLPDHLKKGAAGAPASSSTSARSGTSARSVTSTSTEAAPEAAPEVAPEVAPEEVPKKTSPVKLTEEHPAVVEAAVGELEVEESPRSRALVVHRLADGSQIYINSWELAKSFLGDLVIASTARSHCPSLGSSSCSCADHIDDKRSMGHGCCDVGTQTSGIVHFFVGDEPSVSDAYVQTHFADLKTKEATQAEQEAFHAIALTDIASLEGKVAELTELSKAKETTHAEQEATHATALMDIASLEGKVTELTGLLKANEASQAKQEATHAIALTDIASLEGRVTELTELSKAKEATQAEQEATQAELEATYAIAPTDIESLMARTIIIGMEMKVEAPPGVAAGQSFGIEVPSGEQLHVEVPEGLWPAKRPHWGFGMWWEPVEYPN